MRKPPEIADYRHDELVLGDLLRKAAVANRGKTFLRFRDGEWTYDRFDELVDRTARGFAAAGVSRRMQVAVMLPNGLEFLQAVFALARIGAVSVPINTAYKGEILAHVLNSSDAAMLVIDERWLDRLVAVEERPSRLRKLIVRSASGGRAAPRRGAFEAASFRSLADHPAEPVETRVGFGDLQSIIYTSGTTGPSKGVMVPHAHSLTNALDWIRYTRFRPDETIYCPLPLFHGGALWDGVMSALLAGAGIAIVERFSASRFWDDVRHFGANVALGIFSMIPILLNRPPSTDEKNHSLRCFYLGQSALDEQFYARFGVHSVEMYASTEVGIATASPYGAWRPGSCGQVNAATYEVKVFDEQDRELPPDEPGELVVRPVKPFAMTTGYYNFWPETVAAFRNLWFHTGDRVYRDREGYFYFVDRLSDSIRRKGENVSSSEVERAVNAHPAVVESAAIPVPSEVGEDEIKICVVTESGARLEPAELIAHCEERLPDFMVPRYVETLDRFPKSAIGKVRKNELRSRGRGGITPETWDREQAGDRLRKG